MSIAAQPGAGADAVNRAAQLLRSVPGVIAQMHTIEQTNDETATPTSRCLVWTEVGLTCLVYQGLITLFIVEPPVLLRAWGVRLDIRNGTAVTLGCTLVAELIILGLLALRMRHRRLSFSDLGLGRKTTKASLWLAVLFGAGYGAFTLWALDLAVHLHEVSVFRLWGMFVGVVGAVIEELVFRGFLLAELQRIRVSPAWQVFVSASLFSLVHLSFSAGGVLATFVMGAALGALYTTGRRSLAAPITCHVLVNLLVEPWLLLWLITYYASQHR